MEKKYHFIVLAVAVLAIVMLAGCVPVAEERPQEEGISVEGVFERDLGHPFSGPAIMTKTGYYRIGGDRTQEIIALEDKVRIRVFGTVSEHKRMVPEAGEMREITEKTIEAKSFEVLE